MKLELTKRDVVGKKVETLRKQGLVPVICYGNREKSMSYSIDTKALKTALASDKVVFETSGGLPDKQVIVQDVDYHPISGEPVHVDLLFVDTTHEVESEVSIQIEGEAPAVKTHVGQILTTLDKITIRALPQHIPSQLVVDISQLTEVGARLLVSDIVLPENVTLVTNPSEIIVSIVEESKEEEQETKETDEDYLSKIEVTGKGGKREDDPEEEEGGEDASSE